MKVIEKIGNRYYIFESDDIKRFAPSSIMDCFILTFKIVSFFMLIIFFLSFIDNLFD